MIALAVEEMARPLHDRRRRRLQRHPPRRASDRARDRARSRRAAVGQPVLQPPEPARDRRATTRRSCRATDLPILLYNIPQRTGSDMPNELLAELAQLDNICRASSRPTPPTWRRSTGCRSTPATTTCSPTCSTSASPAGSSIASHLFGEEMHRMVDEPDTAPRDRRRPRATSTATCAIAPLACAIKAALKLLGIAVGRAAAAVRRARRAELEVVRAMLERHGMLRGGWRRQPSDREVNGNSCGSCRSAAWARSART